MSPGDHGGGNPGDPSLKTGPKESWRPFIPRAGRPPANRTARESPGDLASRGVLATPSSPKSLAPEASGSVAARSSNKAKMEDAPYSQALGEYKVHK